VAEARAVWAARRAGFAKRLDALSPWQQRLAKAVFVGLVLIAALAPGHGFDTASYLGFLIIAALYVPGWRRYSYGKFIVPVAILGLAVAYPYYVSHMPKIPVLLAFPSVSVAFVMAIYVMMALGLNIVVGYAGLLDLGYVAFYAIGAYTAAWLASPQGTRWGINFVFGGVGVPVGIGGIHISIWLILLVAAVLAGFVGIVIGLPTLRLRGDYLAIVTLGFGEIVSVAALNGDNIGGANITNGPQGINPIDPPGFGHWLHQHLGLPTDFLSATNSLNLFYWAAIALMVIIIVCSLMLRDSKLGRAWIAIREDETAAAAMGVPLMRTKTLAYAIGAFFGGIAGAYFAEFNTGANPDAFSFNFSVFVLVMVILGGVGNVWGVLLGAAFLAYLDQAGLADTGAWLNQHLHVHIDVPKYEFGIYGVILLCVMLFRPNGLIPEARRKLEFEEGVEDQPLYDVTA
jgi:branched-chain amino acid transport system permease protein